MSAVAVAVMAAVCTFVWGGFLALVVRAARSERTKRDGRLDGHPPHPSP